MNGRVFCEGMPLAFRINYLCTPKFVRDIVMQRLGYSNKTTCLVFSCLHLAMVVVVPSCAGSKERVLNS